MTGFKLLTLDSKLGSIAEGFGSLQVLEPAIVASDADTVNLEASETLINKASNFLLEIDLPLPLNAGCEIEVFIPKPLVIGPETTRVIIGGLFGSIRDADIRLDAARNMIKIDNACRDYRQNAVKASMEIEALINPGYVVTSESFFVEIADTNDNAIVKTSGGLVYTTTPGEVLI